MIEDDEEFLDIELREIDERAQNKKFDDEVEGA